MAVDFRSAFVGRPSLRRALQALDDSGQAAFAASVAEVDPLRFKSLYRDRARQFLDRRRALNRTLFRDQLEQQRQLEREDYLRRNFNIMGG